MKAGIYEMPERQYRDLPFLNFSRFKAAADSAKKARHADLSPTIPTSHMIFGSLCHCATLTPELVRHEFAISPEIIELEITYEKTPEGWLRNGAGPFKTKKEAQDTAPRYTFEDSPAAGYRTKTAAKDAIKEAERGRRVVSREDMERAFSISDAVEAHKTAGPLLMASDRREFVAIWDEETHRGPIRCKARIDGYDSGRGIVWDLKTTQSADPGKFSRISCRVWHYDAQIAFYARGMALAAEQSGEPAPKIERVGFVIVEKEAPFEICVAFLKSHMRKAAEEKALDALKVWVEAEASGIWEDKHTDPVWI